MIIRRKPLGADTIRKPQSLGLSLLRQGIARVQALTVRRSSEPDQTPDWGEGIPEEVYDSIYNPATATLANQADPAESFESFDPMGDDGFYADSVADAISRAEQPSPSVRPASNTARRTVRRQAQPQPPAQPTQPAPVQRQSQPPSVIPPSGTALPVATPPAEIIPAPRPASASPSGRPVRRESLSDSDNMPRDLQAMWSLHKQLGHIRERPTGEAAQREAAERAARPRRRAEIVEVMAPKKGLPLDVPDDSVPSSASPIGEPIQRKADGSSTAPAPQAESSDFQDSPASTQTDYYESTDESGVAPVNNTFDGGDTSPEVEFADDVLDDSSDDAPVQRETAFDSSATMVDLPDFSSANEIRRTPQSAPPPQPFAAGPTSSTIPPVDNRSDQGDVAVQRSPSGAAREFAPSPQLTGDPLTDSDDDPSAAGANPTLDFDLASAESGTPDIIQRSASLQAAIARAESPSAPDEYGESAESAFDYADTDYTDRQEPPVPSQPRRSGSAPPSSAQRTPATPNLPPPATPSARPSAVQRSAAPPDNNSPSAPITPTTTPTTDRAAARNAAIARAEQPTPPEYEGTDFEAESESADFDSSSPELPVSRNNPNSPDNIQRSAARNAAIARAEQPTPPEVPASPAPAARPIQRQAQQSAAPPEYEGTDFEAEGEFADFDSSRPEPSVNRNNPNTPDNIQRSAARDAAIARAEQPSSPAVPESDFGDIGDNGEFFDTAVADFDDSAASDEVAPPAAPRSARSAIQRTATPDSYEADSNSEMAFDDFGDEPSSDWVAPANTGDRSAAFAQAIARAEQPAEPAEAPQSPQPSSPSLRRSAQPPLTPEAPSSVQRAARTDTNLPDSRPPKAPNRPDQPTIPERPAVQRSAAGNYDDSDDSSVSSIDNAPEPTGRINRAASIATAIARAEQPSKPASGTTADRPTASSTREAVQRTPQRTFDGFDPDDAFAYDDVAADIETIQSRPARTESRVNTDYGDPNTADPVTNAPPRADRANVTVQRSAASDHGANADDYDDGTDSVAAVDYGDVSDDYAPAANQPGSPITRATTRAQAIARAEQPGSVDQSSAFDQPRAQGPGQRAVQRSPDFVGDSTPSSTEYTAYTASDDMNLTDNSDDGDEGYSGEPSAYSADSDAFAYDDPYNDTSVSSSFEPGSPAPSAQPSLPALPSARAVQRYPASEADVSSDPEAAAEPSTGSSKRPALNWPKLRRKAQAGPAVPPPEQPSVQRSPAADQGDSGDNPASETFESDATPEEMDMLAMLGLPPTARIGRGPSQTTEAPPPIQRATAENSAQRAVEINEMSVNANVDNQSNSNSNSNNNVSNSGESDNQNESDQITKNDVETIAQEVYRQLRNRLRIERERTRGNG